MPSRWTDNADDAAEDARRKLEKAEKKKLRALKQQEEAEKAQREHQKSRQDKHEEPPTKRRRLSDGNIENGSKTHEHRPTTPKQLAARSVANLFDRKFW